MENNLPNLSHLRALALRVVGAIAEVAKAAVDAITEIEGVKADKATFVTVTIPASGWKTNPDNTVKAAGYAVAYDVAVEGATASDSSETVLYPNSLTEATKCGLCPTTATIQGHVRYFAVSAPAQAITAQVRIIKAQGGT